MKRNSHKFMYSVTLSLISIMFITSAMAATESRDGSVAREPFVALKGAGPVVDMSSNLSPDKHMGESPPEIDTKSMHDRNFNSGSLFEYRINLDSIIGQLWQGKVPSPEYIKEFLKDIETIHGLKNKKSPKNTTIIHDIGQLLRNITIRREESTTKADNSKSSTHLIFIDDFIAEIIELANIFDPKVIELALNAVAAEY